jgi:signal transduction histidine kinase
MNGMRISTKIIAGYALLIGIMAALVAYQAISARRMQSALTQLSEAGFRVGRLSLELIRDRNDIEDFTLKSFERRDEPDYPVQLQSFVGSFDRVLKEFRSSARSAQTLQHLNEVLPLWTDFSRQLTESMRGPAQEWPATPPEALVRSLEQLKPSLEALSDASSEGFQSEVQASRKTIRQTESVSLYAAELALILSLLISYLIVRSITKPLRQLTAGTRAVAEGKFGCHLDTSSEDEFAELARDFNSMVQRLGELDTLKKDFVSHVSHELKSPLASMQDNLSLLLDQVPGPLTEKQIRLLGLNLKSAQRLSGMIFNLLDISRMEAGALNYEMEAHNLSEIIRAAVAEIEPKAREQRHSLRMQVPESIPLRCDHNRIHQVLINLLDNAIKFSPPTGNILISAGPISEALEGMPSFARASYREYTMLTVTDQGPGVPDELKEKIFQRFHQTGKTAQMAGQGVGLGLAIARTIVEAHGGAIWTEDNPGGGSRFVVLLRLQGAALQAVSAPI